MPTQALLEQGRRAAERLMTDSCIVERDTGQVEMDPETGQNVPVVDTVYAGPCKLGSTPSTGEQMDSGDHRYLLERPRLHLPITADVRTGDYATITATETGNVSTGIAFRLVDLNRGTHKTSQRWNLEAPTG